MSKSDQPAGVAVDRGVRPRAWMRAWHFAGEQPTKEKRENGRAAWPAKFKFLAVSPAQVMPDDVALYAVDAEHMAASLFQHIAHGDEKHREWLQEQALAWARSYLGPNAELTGAVRRPVE